MTDQPPIDHQSLEYAYVPASQALDRLPDCVESRRAKQLLDESEKVAHVAREKHVREE
jgi:hypothetical protein